MWVLIKEEVKTKLKLKVLSPIHIGTGEEFSPWNFALRGNYLFVIKMEEVLEDLYNNDMDKYEEALSLLEEGKGNIDQFLPQQIPDEWIVYKIELHPSVNPQKIKKISTAIKNITLDRKPVLYIPASEIKGFIRTAIIYCYIRDNFNDFKDKFQNINPKFSFRKIVEDELFGKSSEDIMKYLKIEDVYGDFKSEVVGVKIVLSSKFWIENVEAITDGRSKSFVLKVDKRVLNTELCSYIRDWKKCCYEFSKDFLEAEIQFWEDIHNGKMEKYLNNLSNNERDPEEKKIIVNVLNRVRSANKTAAKIKNHLERISHQNSEETPLIRIGKFTGYLSHTVAMLLRGRINKYNSSGIYNIAPIGNDIKAKNAKWFLFPLTRRLTLDNQTLGWCKLS